MKNKKLIKVGNIVKILLEAFEIISIVFLIFLYFIVKKIGIHFDLFIGLIYPCGISFIYIVYQFINLFKTLNDNPFCLINVKRFKKCMYCSSLISLLVIIGLIITIFVYNYYSLQLKVALIFISILFFAASIAFYVLSELFRTATKYKEENDLTI